MAEHDDLFGAFLDLAQKLVAAEGHPDPQRVSTLLLHELADPEKGAVYLGHKIATDLSSMTNALHLMRLEACDAKPFPTAAAMAKKTGLKSSATLSPTAYGSDDAKELGEGRRDDLMGQLDGVMDKHAQGKVRDAPILDKDGERVGTTVNPTQEWECPCGGMVHATPEVQPADCVMCGGAYARVAKGTYEPLTRYAFRCWTCGAGGICKELELLREERHAAGCDAPLDGFAGFDTWPAGVPTGGRQKCAEDLPGLLGKKAKKARITKSGELLTCQLCEGPIKPGDLQRVYKHRRACEPCMEKHGKANEEAAKEVLVCGVPVPGGDDSTAEDW